ncbi:MAG TPA: hypothetical protein VFP87_04265 [Chitinophagaceae bacterium]|nr:hypothetical protein [Chitinophagaceae bacterium]
MRAVHTFFLLILTQFSFSQEQDEIEYITKGNPMFLVAKNYFRSNPFNIHFSAFLNHLTHDPTLSNKTFTKRTNTALFFFQGDYTTHNPYNFKPDRVEIRLAERPVNMEDSLSTIDTLLFYQLVGYGYGPAGMESVRKEFARFDRKYGKNFYSEDYQLKKDDDVIGMTRNYFLLSATFLSPLSITWAKLDDHQNVFTITFRIKITENMATLPQPSNGHQ